MKLAKLYVRNICKGVTFAELVVVLVILSLFLGMAMVNVTGMYQKYKFKGQVQDLVNAFQMVSTASAEKGKRYEVIIDLSEQSYMVREITNADLSEVLEEEIIIEGWLDNSCFVSYAQFDDNTNTDEEHQLARFRIGPGGWQYGGKVVLLDLSDRPYTIVISRVSRYIELKNGDVQMLMPKSEDELQLQ
jgi:type II secretory pathway pseudopilin PulG